MTTQHNGEDELREEIKHTFKRYHDYLNGPVPSDLLFGRPDVEPFDVLLDEVMAAIHANSQSLTKSLLAEVEERGPKDRTSDAPGYDFDRGGKAGFNQCNKQWRRALQTIRQERLGTKEEN